MDSNSNHPTARGMTAWLLELGEGMDESIADAPDMSIGEIRKRLRGLGALSGQQRGDEAETVVYSFLKGVKAGKWRIEQVM
jgi:hypothetical protein